MKNLFTENKFDANKFGLEFKESLIKQANYENDERSNKVGICVKYLLKSADLLELNGKHKIACTLIDLAETLIENKDCKTILASLRDENKRIKQASIKEEDIFSIEIDSQPLE